MNPAESAGRLLLAALPGPDLDRATETALRDLSPAGLILFARNLKSAGQLADLVAGLREVVGRPFLLAIDQEGGPVNRMAEVSPEWKRLPDGRTQASWPEERLFETWFRVGRALAAAGFNVDFAPVVDLDDGPGTNAIGRRSFGTDPGRAAACARLVLAGLEKGGVAGCLKHFPGLGGTDLDTHLGLARSPLTERALREQHASPYIELASVAPMVMTSHAHYPEVDGPEPLPATFSRKIVTGWLREWIGFEGLVVSDDLEMGAVRGTGPEGERAARALAAGCDLALFCHALDAPRHARDELARRITSGALGEDVLRRSRTRQAALLARFAGTGPAPSYRDALEALADTLG